MSHYDEMSTAELASGDVLPPYTPIDELIVQAHDCSGFLGWVDGEVRLNEATLSQIADVIDGLLNLVVPYRRIVEALRDLPATAVYDAHTNTCRLCDWIDGEHTDACPWSLAQQTGSGK